MIITKECIRHNGVDYAVNEKIENINKKDEERLINLGVAFYPETILVGDDGKDPGGDGKDPGGDGKDPEHIDLTPEEAVAELDKLFNYNELKDAAKAVGLEFSGNISKANLISMIIEKNKAEEVFDFVEEEE